MRQKYVRVNRVVNRESKAVEIEHVIIYMHGKLHDKVQVGYRIVALFGAWAYSRKKRILRNN